MALAQQAVSGAASVSGKVASMAISAILFGSFNPIYKKENQKRMRYIQSKYARAYAGAAVEDFDAIIQKIDQYSKIRMIEGGTRPANPFPDDKSFEESLEISYFPVSGHQGRFAASHAMKCLGEICQYQIQRKKRLWVPGVSSSGQPNDYINLFLEEMKTWLRNQLTLDNVAAEELKRREQYISKLKHDKYYWCFPEENSHAPYTIHSLLDTVHETILDALEVVTREEKNKSLQLMFKELNDNTNNSFEFGKNFLAYLLYASKKAGSDLLTSNALDSKTLEKGSLHRALINVTAPVMQSYVVDMRQTEQRIESGAIGYRGATNGNLIQNNNNTSSPLQISNNNNNRSVGDRGDTNFQVQDIIQEYTVDVPAYEELMTGTLYSIEICDPQNNRWIVRKTFKEFKRLHEQIAEEFDKAGHPLTLPPNMAGLIASVTDYESRAELLRKYTEDMLIYLGNVSSFVKKIVCKFLETKDLLLSSATQSLVHVENISNIFVKLKSDYKEQLVILKKNEKNKKNEKERICGKSKDLQAFQQTWGIEWVIKIYDAYAMLQRMSTLLAWTLEINHFFLSMFGNTLAFSKLPLRDIIMTLKDILSAFLSTCNSLFTYACQLNSDQQYKWHKNLQACENHLSMLRHHVEKSIEIINRIESDHLDYETQMRRLMDVATRFQPLMNRITTSLPQIQQELGLPPRPINIENEDSNNSNGATNVFSAIDFNNNSNSGTTNGVRPQHLAIKAQQEAVILDDDERFQESLGEEEEDEDEVLEQQGKKSYDAKLDKHKGTDRSPAFKQRKADDVKAPLIAEGKEKDNINTIKASGDQKSSEVCVVS